jgi:hypothetical protein
MTPSIKELRAQLRQAETEKAAAENAVSELEPAYRAACAAQTEFTEKARRLERLISARTTLEAARKLSTEARAALLTLYQDPYKAVDQAASDELRSCYMAKMTGSKYRRRLELTTRGDRAALALLTWGVE